MAGRVVVYGGRGALGSTIVTRFKETGYWVASVDTRLSECCDENILVEGDEPAPALMSFQDMKFHRGIIKALTSKGNASQMIPLIHRSNGKIWFRSSGYAETDVLYLWQRFLELLSHWSHQMEDESGSH